jgi:hypothetical protein
VILANVIAAALPALLPAAGVPKDRVAIVVSMNVTKSDGSTGGSVFGMTPSLEVGKQTTFLLGRSPAYCGGSIRFGGSFDADTTTGWRVEVTPLKVSAIDTVTFRLAWSRAIANGKPSGAAEPAVELTLGAGQTVPLDVQPWAEDPNHRCGVNQAVVTVGVQPPPREMDRQLVQTDLWLIDKSNGVERTQRLTLRGRYGEGQPYFFDDIVVGDRLLDLSGDIRVFAREDGVDLEITTLRRRTSPDGRTRDHAEATSRIRVLSGGTAAIEFPGNLLTGDPFAGHEVSLRIQSREVRPATGPQTGSVFGGNGPKPGGLDP